MNTTIKTASEKQFAQIRRFVKKNKIYHTIIEDNVLYSIKLFGLKPKEIEKFINSPKPITLPKSSSRSHWLLLHRHTVN